MRDRILLLAAVLLAPGHASVPTIGGDEVALARALDSVDADAMRADLEFVASDEMGGRDTPSPGLLRTARFLRDRLRELEVAPGARDGYFYRWSRAWRRIDGERSGLTIARGDGTAVERFVFGTDYFLANPRELGDLTVAGGIVSAGDGSARTVGIRRLDGAWALVRPDGGSLRRLADRVGEAGAVGILVLPAEGEQGPDVQYARVARYMLEGRFGTPGSSVFPTVMLTTGAEFRLFAAAGVDALPEPGLRMGLVAEERRRLTHPGGNLLLENVCGFWEGSDPRLKSEVIVLSAHYDHVGVQRGEIHNGADDNGSGTCGLLAVAKALTEYGPMRRSVLMTWVSGEEKGLWGSEAWTKRPWLPPGFRPICDINIDMIGRNAPDDLMITPTKRLGKHYNGLVRLAEALGPTEGFGDFRSADSYWRRSDHMNFADHLGLPVAFLFADEHEDYHKPGDDADKIDYGKMRRVVRLVLRMLDGLQEDSLDLPAAPSLEAFQQSVRSGQVATDLEYLRSACYGWAREHDGTWPEELDELLGVDDAAIRTYVGDTLPIDPWGNAYRYRRTPSGGQLKSLGSDGAEGGRGEAEDVTLDG